MNAHMLRRVRRLFPSDSAPPHVVRHNRRAWVRSVRYLGDRWLLAVPVPHQKAAR